ncbi:hypothetical protein E3N88_07319 [Mikania micrantha]|uniref:Reverse transcriptase Ty1/copia-type domain-containing protein n=1 Tax=Mikania micrantha TaxID=192012 RepID=A0A5N6PR81_9ASTR|nr:hypothetical protein E3N88_07319 [Mikania micrantha]
MKKKFEMCVIGEMTFFFGLQVKQDPKGVLIHQGKYVTDILTKFNMLESKPASTPMAAARPVLTSDSDGEAVDQYLYRSMIGSLMYLTTSQPDIMFSVCQCARYQANPKASHLIAVKRIFRYLVGKPHRKLTTGGCQYLGDRLVSWQCKKQTTVSTSTTKAEYVAASSCCSQVIWMQQQLLDYSLNFLDSPIYCDNEATLQIVKNPVQHSKTKHIDILLHFIRDCFKRKLIHLEKRDLPSAGTSADASKAIEESSSESSSSGEEEFIVELEPVIPPLSQSEREEIQDTDYVPTPDTSPKKKRFAKPKDRRTAGSPKLKIAEPQVRQT